MKPGILFVGLAAASAAAWALPDTGRLVEDRYGRPLRVALSPASLDSRPAALDDISPYLVLATLAVEDQRFYSHPGVDLRAVGRALVQNLRAGKVVSGASTLTQQLARALEPRPRSLWGKAKEAWKALQLEEDMDKPAILAAYLNLAPYGGRLQGAEAAAQSYFGVPARDLSLAQAALLAGIPKSPARYDPRKNPRAARERQGLVLDRMGASGWVDAESLRLARAEAWSVRSDAAVFEAPHFTRALLALRPGPSRLHGSLDGRLQSDLQALLRRHVESLQDHQVGNAALVVLDNDSGDVLAYVGSQDFFDEAGHGQVDGASALRQPGSALKPFLYGLAFEQGLGPHSLIDDEPWVAPDGYTAYNYDRGYRGRVSLRQALACSYNVPAVRLAHRVGTRRLLRRLRDVGLDSLDRPAGHYGLGLALGNGEVSLLALANAYASLARGGLHRPWRMDRDEAPPPPRRVMDERAAYLVLQVLGDNGARAPAFGLASPLQLPFPLAAKTGTTKDYRDNWCVGVTPRWTVAAWCGNFDGSPMRHVSGITGAGPLMRDAALRVAQDRPGGTFRRPQGLVDLDVCADSGDLPTLRCPRRRRESTLAASAPARDCGLHPAPGPARAALGRPRILSPAPDGKYLLDPHLDRAAQALPLRAEGLASEARVQWRVNGQTVSTDALGDAFWPLEAGWHKAELLVSLNGRTRTAAPSHFRVLR